VIGIRGGDRRQEGMEKAGDGKGGWGGRGEGRVYL
jgi:hypothetical protein